jgi:MFS family permease
MRRSESTSLIHSIFLAVDLLFLLLLEPPVCLFSPFFSAKEEFLWITRHNPLRFLLLARGLNTSNTLFFFSHLRFCRRLFSEPKSQLKMYYEILGLLSVVFIGSLATRFASLFQGPASANPEFRSFQRSFLLVYLIMMAADWMQGPYVYRLYSYYGFSRQDNGVLFIAGFGSSLFFGTWAGPLADQYGRKLCCLMYAVTYILSCMTKHFPDFTILMIGRLLGGIATSILWSAFESWMVSEHLSRKFDPEWIGNTFSLMITLNGIVAILSGFVAQFSVYVVDHPVAPFDVSAAFLAVGAAVIYFTWSENYGDARLNVLEQMSGAIKTVSKDRRIMFVGLQQALFEGAMYTFVFLWTPALEREDQPVIPYGIIFACFMIACSLGGTVFGYTASLMPLQKLMRCLYIAAAFLMSAPMVTTETFPIFVAFVLFEIVVGMFWPGIGTLRSKYIPEECRATVINLFRVPLNIIVCIVLYNQGSMSVQNVFAACTIFHILATLSALGLESITKHEDKVEPHGH